MFISLCKVGLKIDADDFEINIISRKVHLILPQQNCACFIEIVTGM